MLFRLVSGKDPFELNPGLRAIPQFNKLTDRQMFFVCLVADTDRDNPIVTQPERQRRERAAMIAGYPMEADGKRPDKNARDIINGKINSVEDAIVEYKRNQFDEDKANEAALNQQIQEIRECMATNKRKQAEVVEKKTAKDGTKTERKYTDEAQVFDLVEKAAKLGKGLPDLIEARDKLRAKLKAKDPVKLEIITHTAADLPAEDEDGDEAESTIDRVMRLQNDQAN
jgi:hypothetical protein